MTSTGVTPFEAIYGEKLDWGNPLVKKQDSNVPAARKQAANIVAMQKLMEKHLAKAVAAQAKFYNFKHLSQQYNVGDYVYLNSKNIDLTWPSKKLDWKFYGPYMIRDIVGKQAYCLNLPLAMKIHNVFHVLLLEPCDLSRDGTAPPFLPPIEVDGKEEYEVKKILDSKTYCGKLQYLVKWLGYPDTDNQWVYKDQVAEASNLVKLFHW